MKRIFAFLTVLFAAAGVYAQAVVGEGDAAAGLERRFGLLEESIARLTSEVEEASHRRREELRGAQQALQAAVMQLRDALSADREEAQRRFAAYDAEIAGLKIALNALAVENPGIGRAAGAPGELIAAPLSDGPVPEEAAEDLLVPPAVPEGADSAAFEEGYALFESGNYEMAAEKFADGIKEFPAGHRFFDSVFYLGLSMRHAGRAEDACRAFAVVADSSEGVDPDLKERAAASAASLECAKE
ncbi:MAG: hypothetical protein LBO78_03945 [Rickettsiales bacterium]|jgi:TolA-binding protein|nr:hypothetical protein [Rickettsiales bacterium]